MQKLCILIALMAILSSNADQPITEEEAIPVLANLFSYADLEWDPSPDESVIGYKIYFGHESGRYTSVVDVGNVKQARIDLGELSNNRTWFIAATSYDDAGLESDFSNEVKVEEARGPQ